MLITNSYTELYTLILGVCVCSVVYVHVDGPTPLWAAGEGSRGLLLLLFTFFLKRDLLLSQKPCILARLTGQGALGIYLSLYPQYWDIDIHLYLAFVWVLGIRIYVFMFAQIVPLPTEPFPQHLAIFFN